MEHWVLTFHIIYHKEQEPSMNKINKIVLSGIVALLFVISGCSENDNIDSTTKTPSTPTDPIELPAVVDPYQAAGWYGRTEVTATAPDGTTYSHKSAGVFGKLVQSSDEKDQHDIPGYGPALLQVIFIPDFSTDTTAGYFSEYKHYDGTNAKASWTFQVKNQQDVDLSTAPITIKLSAVHDVRYRDDNGTVTYKESSESNITLLNQLTLVDVDNGIEYSASDLQTAFLNMNGKHTRTFRWVLGTVESTDYEPLAAPQRAAGRENTPEFKPAPARQNGRKFGLPPQ